MRWGDWVFDAERLTLGHERSEYEVDLERIQSSAAVLDWIFQIRGKGWADAKTVYDLLHALFDILNPQRNYCPNEQDTRADGGALARAFVVRST